MKRIGILLITVLIAFTFSCGGGGEKEQAETQETEEKSSEESAAKWEDGIYFAQEDGFSERTGWKYMATLKVEDGKIVEAEWNGANVNGGTDKITRSESGEYGMVEKGDAQAPWFEQAAKAEEYLLKTQDPTDINYTDDAGSTDSISGVSIHVREFFTLAEEALEKGPTGYGMWEDGHYYAEDEEFSHGWKYYADITVVSGYIVAASWNGLPEEGDKLKKQASIDGDYGMVEKGDAQAPWFEQAKKAEQHLLKTQDPTDINYTSDEGHTDSISGVTIHVKEFFSLAEKALEGAKR